MDEERAAMKENGVFEEIDEAPNGVQPLPTKWIFKRKTKADKTFKYKARLVIRGDKQQEGIDYEKKFSPVIKFSTMRTILKLIQLFELQVKLSDIMTAFQNSALFEDVYAWIDGLLGKLLRALYGLKQASLAWFM